MPPPDSLDVKRFELLHDHLSQLQASYLHNVVWTVGALLVAIGWILTSDHARKFLEDNSRARRIALAAITAMALLNTVALLWAYCESESISAALQRLNYLEFEQYRRRRIALHLLGIYSGVHLALFFALLQLVLSLSKATANPANIPLWERALKTLAVVVGLGIIEATIDRCVGGMRWRGLSSQTSFLVVVVIATVIVSLASLLTATMRWWWQFGLGAACGIGLELANQLWLSWWEWSPQGFGLLPGPWPISVALGVFAGLGPVVTNYLVDKALSVGRGDVHKRVVISRYGKPPVLAVIEEEVPEPRGRQVRVKVLAAGVAFGDTMMRAGVYPKALKLPFTPGYDVVGFVDKLGSQASSVQKGQLVAALMPGGHGGYAEFVCVSEDDLIPVPAGLDLAETVCVVLNYLTAHQMLHRLAKVQPGERILIHGAGGGVGTALLELGSLIPDVTMYGTASPAKHALVKRLGGIPIDYKTQDFAEEVRHLTGDGVDSVFDAVGGRHWRKSYDVLRQNGRLVAYGYSDLISGSRRYLRRIASFFNAASTAMRLGYLKYLKRMRDSKHRSVKWYDVVKTKRQNPGWYHEDLRSLLNLLGRKGIQPVVANTYPLTAAAAAHQDLLNTASVSGKIVLIPGTERDCRAKCA